MKERPIIFSGPMVRAILDGRKNQTRRVIKPQPEGEVDVHKCPYGEVGDRLWVRETWRVSSESNQTPDGKTGRKTIYCNYRATDGRTVSHRGKQTRTEFRTPEDDDLASRAWGKGASGTWRPSIYMPRWASRITLEVTDVRVERVQEITVLDAVAEGCVGIVCDDPLWADCGFNGWCFAHLWDSINAKRGYGWESNPWVWVVEFRRSEQ